MPHEGPEVRYIEPIDQGGVQEMTNNERNDPYPGYGGKPISPLLSIGIILILISFGLGALAFGSQEGGYDEVKALASVKCLGCLGLNSVVPGFEEFWTDYPEGHEKEGQPVDHPDFILDAFERDDVALIVLFYWTPGCVPCAEQWKAMEKEGITSGPEDGGREGEKYQGMLLYSLNAAEFGSYEIDVYGTIYSIVPNDLFWTYHYNGDPYQNGVPDTVFIFERDGEIFWWMWYGKEMPISEVDGMITKVLYHEIAHAD
jgi:hypothetical protein